MLQVQHKQKKPLASRPGSALLELLIAIFLVGVAVTAITMAILYGYKSLKIARAYTSADLLARQQIETIRATGFDNLSTPVTTTQTIQPDTHHSVSLTTASTYLDAPTNNLKQVTVTASWQEGLNQRTVQYVTILSSEGLTP